MNGPKYPKNAAEMGRLDVAMFKLKAQSRALMLRRANGERLLNGDGTIVVNLRDRGLLVGWKLTSLGEQAVTRIKAEGEARTMRRQTATERRISAGLGVAAE